MGSGKCDDDDERTKALFPRRPLLRVYNAPPTTIPKTATSSRLLRASQHPIVMWR